MTENEPTPEERAQSRAEALSAHDELFRLLTEHALDFIRLHDLDGRSVYASASVDRLYGQAPATLFEFAHPDDLEACRRWWQQVRAGANIERLRWRVRDGDGKWRWLDTAASPVRFRDRPHVLTVCREVTEQVKAEQALRESQQRLHMIITTLPVGVVVLDRSGDVILANPASERIWGHVIVAGPERWARSKGHWHDSGKPIEAEEWASVRALSRGQTSLNELIDIETFDHRTKTIANSAAPIRDASGLIVGAVVVNEDVTERVSAEAALRESERKLADAGRVAHLGYWEYDFNADRGTGSEECYRFIGLSPQRALTLAEFRQLIHPDDRALHIEAWERAIRGPCRYDLEYRIVRPDGEVRFIHSIDEMIRDPSGRPLRMFGVWQDITEQRRAERALLAAEQRLQHVVASSPAVLFTLRVEDGRFRGISWMSENIETMLGYRVEDTLAADWWMNNIHPEDRDVVVKQFLSEAFGGVIFSVECRFRHKDGRYRWIRGENRLLRDAAGQPTEAVGSLSDITERKRLEDQFRQAQKMEAVGELAGGVAHDFNNLLLVISGYSEILLAELPPAEPGREMVSEIRRAGQRAEELTRQLLAFSRQAVLEPKVLNLNDVVQENDKMLRRLIGEDVQLTLLLDAALQPVRVDAGQVSQVIMNLAVNARDAMPIGGRLSIETGNVNMDAVSIAANPEARPGPYVLLAVTDTGAGMTPEVLAHIFEPFFTTKVSGKGTGLGLATVYGIVKQSGGFVHVSSEPGRGTAFKIYFPAVEGETSTVGSLTGHTPAPRGTETILLVEDEDAVRSMVRVLLQQAGYTVLEASRGTEALRLAGDYKGPIHLLVTDVVMPEMGGRELVERLSSLRPDLKVLYLSGYTDDAVVRHGVLQAEVAFLQKPFTIAALMDKVRHVLKAA